MYDLATINRINQQYGDEAEAEGKEPVVPTPEEIDTQSLQIPALDGYEPLGWVQLEQCWFVDSSGFGRPDELALTMVQFLNDLHDYMTDNPEHGVAITECGQFQLYVHAYRRGEEGDDED